MSHVSLIFLPHFNIFGDLLLNRPMAIENLFILFNPVTPTIDHDRISPYNVNTISSRQVMRTKKNIS